MRRWLWMVLELAHNGGLAKCCGPQFKCTCDTRTCMCMCTGCRC
jgi:hypothetical protein